LPSDKKEEVLDEYVFDHLKDDISEEDHREGKGCNTLNKFMQKVTITLLILFAIFLQKAT
jgi:hypothetical protein